jgi:hypothetical protein
MMDEFYHFPMTGPYTREKLHVLLSVDADRAICRRGIPASRPRLRDGVDQDDGKGRVFNSVLGTGRSST